jgi:Icc-related predicted phosphoesterase
MRLHILSDLHLGARRLPETFMLPDVDADLLILAGDIQRHTDGLAWAARVGRTAGKQVIYVPGNHEYYHADLPEMLVSLRKEARRLGIYLLSNDSVVIDGVRFLGSTLWTDFHLYPSLGLGAMQAAGSLINDFKVIRNAGSDFTPEQSVQLHHVARAWLEEELSTTFAGPTVVVTHHAPHSGSVAERFESDLLTPAFASDLSQLIERYQPELWVHGHMHDCFDYRVGETRIVCNPVGYVNERNEFDLGLVIGV